MCLLFGKVKRALFWVMHAVDMIITVTIGHANMIKHGHSSQVRTSDILTTIESMPGIRIRKWHEVARLVSY
jgi:hypothetical protein